MNSQNNRSTPRQGDRAYAQRRPVPQGRPAQSGYRSAPQGRPAQRPPQRPSGGGSGRGSGTAKALPYGLPILVIAGIVVIVLAYVLQRAWPDGFPLATKKASSSSSETSAAITEIHSGGPIRINEIMTSNMNTIGTAEGDAPDWIEIINTGRSAVNLSGYSLSKSANATTVFKFPELTLAPDECVLVYADSKLREEAGEELHAPFRISSKGDTLMLFNESGTAIDTVNIPSLEKDHSYARVNTSTWEKSAQPTPCLANTQENYIALTTKATDSPVIVTEVMASNKTTLEDENGQYYDYIELYNRSGETVDLTGWHLSDDKGVPRKWTFPSVSLGSGQYMVVYASKLDRKTDTAHLHTNFSLRGEGESVVLSNASGRIMDIVDYDILRKDVAYSFMSDGSWTTSSPATPGKANN